MSNTARCPNCQRPLAENAPAGLCPVCLFAGLLTSPDEDADDGVSEGPPPFPEDRKDIIE
jgi:hypothetical protein